MEYLEASAKIIEQQVMDNPGIGIPVDPDVADYMGAFDSDEDMGDVLEGVASEEI
jgi:hypothetical protein